MTRRTIRKSPGPRARWRLLSTPDLQDRREDLLRPSPWLGYGREALAIHLMSRGAHALAESQLRRMVWLNPFEPRFAERLRRCLLAQGKTAEARYPGRIRPGPTA
jgi:hypothetical protein